MKGESQNTYDGSHAGKIIIPRIKSAQRKLLICSPFISPEYARLLVSKAQAGIDVYILTSEARDNQVHQEALRILSASYGGATRTRKLAMVGAGICLTMVGLIFSTVERMAALLAVVGVIVLLATWFLGNPVSGAQERVRSLQLKVSRTFIHSKIYAVDDWWVASGSPNLTFSGLNKNVEHLDIHEGKEAQPDISSFYRLWDRST